MPMYGYPPNRNRPITGASEVGLIVRDLMKVRDLEQIDSNFFHLGGGTTSGEGVETESCVTGAYAVMTTAPGNLEDCLDDLGANITDSILVTAAEADSCIEFDWLDSDRIPRIVFGEGKGIPPEAFSYGLDDIYPCFDWRYDSITGLWSPTPIEFFTTVDGEPLKIKRAIIVGVPVSPIYPRGFKIDPVQMGIGWEIHLQQFLVQGVT